MNRIFVLALGTILFPATTFGAFNVDLRYGSTGAGVFELQEFLTAQGVYTGPITGNFYSLTLAGVKAFQSREAISPVSGYFGPLSRARANAILEAELVESDKEAASSTGSTLGSGSTSNESTGGGSTTEEAPVPFEIGVSFEQGSGNWDEDGEEEQLYGGSALFTLTYNQPVKVAVLRWWKADEPNTVYPVTFGKDGKVWAYTFEPNTSYSWEVEATNTKGQKDAVQGTLRAPSYDL